MEQVSQPATTYQETSCRYRGTGDARERFDELAVRDVSARAFTALVAKPFVALVMPGGRAE